jgi:hypothetical protein
MGSGRGGGGEVIVACGRLRTDEDGTAGVAGEEGVYTRCLQGRIAR